SWKKMSDTVSGATGPHYYQELVASPHVFDKIYLMDTKVQVSENGGKDFYVMNESDKHVDNHSLTFKMSDPNYLLIGTDGGVYESFDDTNSWKFVGNLPLTQFYKLAVDDAYPFYNIFGGTQDNNTQGGPSRTFKTSGITNSDWFVLLGGDGHQPATEPGNPNIVYAQSQQGNIHRIDRTNGEATFIKPQNDLNEPYERFNWDAPILVSPHDSETIFFGSQRVWVSNNRGDEWKAISADLTLDQERFELPIMGKVQSWDNPWDVYAMSTYNTITSLSQSPVDENIIYAGTDDGIIQYTRDFGQNWTKVDVEKLPGVPKGSFVNDIKADLFDPNTVYVLLDNHKFGDYKPYVYKSNDGGKNWKNITEGIPDGFLCWRLVQDHVDKNLMFLGTEYGIYISVNGGNKWVKFSSGLPTISIRDLAIQKRENDLIAATFGRGFYVLDDYSSLRFISANSLKDNLVFTPRKALQYNPIRPGSSSQGSNTYYAKNPDYGAIFTFYMSDEILTKKQNRLKVEKDLEKTNSDIPFPGWEELDEELNEKSPLTIIEIYDSENSFVERLTFPYKKGFNRVSWDLSKKIRTHVSSGSSRFYSPSIRVSPGKYSFNVYTFYDGQVNKIGSKFFDVERIRSGVLGNPNKDKIEEYVIEIENTYNDFSVINSKFNKIKETNKSILTLISRTNNFQGSVDSYNNIQNNINKVDVFVSGNKSKKDVREKDVETISDRLSVAVRGFNSSYGPTKMHIMSLSKAKSLILEYNDMVEDLSKDIDKLKNQLESATELLILD
ncbi:MAG: glycosyl hydrolase, partial [Flavobacteriaceae bacterium]